MTMTFRGVFDFLSNFYPAMVEVDGIAYQNAEAAFQAQKCLDVEKRREFSALTGTKAKRKGRQVPLRPDWDGERVVAMRKVVHAKFTQNENLSARLLATGDMPLVEGNSWGDTFWGVDVRTGKGENQLGKILMEVRGELRRGQNG